MSDTKETDFESQMQALEQLVDRLESGELSLDDAMKTFEQGIRLTRECQTALDSAEQKVQVLLGEASAERLEPLDDED